MSREWIELEWQGELAEETVSGRTLLPVDAIIAVNDSPDGTAVSIFNGVSVQVDTFTTPYDEVKKRIHNATLRGGDWD